MAKENPYELPIADNLPPGTDTLAEAGDHPRQPRSPRKATREVPEWPPEEERRGKWVDKYLETLDPETEYDQIIKTSVLFGATPFGISLVYTIIIIMNSQTPAGAAAVHGGKVVDKGHQRYYGTQLSELSWVLHGSTAPSTIKDIERINQMHARVYARKPGTYSSKWEGKMTITGQSYFNSYIRKIVGARVQAPSPKIQAAYPLWGEQITSHFRTEPEAGSHSFGCNYPRDWEELEAFFNWVVDFPYEKYTTPEQVKIGHESAELFVTDFCDFWFPRPFRFIGRCLILTFTPKKCRDRQQLGHPNWILSKFLKTSIKIYLDYLDAYVADPVQPPLIALREGLKKMDTFAVDQEFRDWRQRQVVQTQVFVALLGIFLLLGGYYYKFVSY